MKIYIATQAWPGLIQDQDAASNVEDMLFNGNVYASVELAMADVQYDFDMGRKEEGLLPRTLVWDDLTDTEVDKIYDMVLRTWRTSSLDDDFVCLIRERLLLDEKLVGEVNTRIQELIDGGF